MLQDWNKALILERLNERKHLYNLAHLEIDAALVEDVYFLISGGTLSLNTACDAVLINYIKIKENSVERNFKDEE